MTPPCKTQTDGDGEPPWQPDVRGEFPAGAPCARTPSPKELAVSRIPVRSPDATGSPGAGEVRAHRGAVVTMLDTSAIEGALLFAGLLEADTLFHAVDLMTEGPSPRAQAIPPV